MGISRRKAVDRMLAFVCLLGLLAGSASASEEQLMYKMNKYMLMNACWGEEAMKQFSLEMYKAADFCMEIQTPGVPDSSFNPSAVGNQVEALQKLLANPLVSALLRQQQQPSFRGKRQAENGLLNPTAEDHREFLEDYDDFKMDWHTKMGNLSCVMTQLKMLDAAGNINIDSYSRSTLDEYFRNSPAGADPAFLDKMANGFSDCYDISRSWPQVSLDRNPMYKKYGRHMIFFECVQKVEMKMCAQHQIYKMMETYYGSMENLPNKLELDVDKYDAAKVAIMTMYNAASKEEKFVDDFFWQKGSFF